MIRELFRVPTCKEDLSAGQRNWLIMISTIPQVKEVMGEKVRDVDLQVSLEAKEILAELS